MENYEINRRIRDEMKRYVVEDYCPECKADTTMVKVAFWPDEGDSVTKYRCMNCLRLFTKEFKEEVPIIQNIGIKHYNQE